MHRDNSEKIRRKLVWLAVLVKGNWTAGEQSVKDTFNKYLFMPFAFLKSMGDNTGLVSHKCKMNSRDSK